MHQRAAPAFRAGRILLAGDAAHVTNPTGGLGLTSGLFDAFALYPSLAAVVKGAADEALLDDFAATRRAGFVDRASPQAARNKELIFHANRGGEALEEALGGLRLMAGDPQVRLERLMFTKSLETPSPRRKGAVVTQSYRPHDLHAASAAPLVLAAQGFFWVGAERVDLPSGPALRGQTYVEYWIPADLRHPLPIVMIHGGGGQGTDMLGTADGREGWVKWFVRAGYAVYAVDRPGHAARLSIPICSGR